jgi:hypothetical protein
VTTKAAILHSIRRKCIDCSGGRPGGVRKCAVTACDLRPFRMGADPEPSRSRGFAKSTVYTGGFDGGGHERVRTSAAPARLDA